MYLKCENLRFVLIDEIENLGAETLAIVDVQTRKAAQPGFKQRPNASKAFLDRPFGGLNLLMLGDWWQLPPVLQKSLCGTPFVAHSHEAQGMLAMFWSRGVN